MKTYNKSRIMKEAHRMMRVEGLSRSVALTLACDKARRSEYYWTLPNKVVRPRIQRVVSVEMQNTLISYYANNSYNMD